MNETTHIASAFDRDLDAIQALIMKMGGLVETAIADSAKALEERDVERASGVRKNDKLIDALDPTRRRSRRRCARPRYRSGSDV